VPLRAVVRGEYLRGEQPVGAMATRMARINVVQFCEPMPESLHGRLLLQGNNGDTAVTGPQRRPVGQAPFLPPSSTPLIPDPRSCSRPADRQNFLEAPFPWEHQRL
jgi:hypothetical protein